MTEAPLQAPEAPHRPRWILRLVLAGLALLVLFLGILLARAIGVSSRQIQATPMALLALEEGPLHARLSAALQIPTVSNEDPAREDRAAFRALREQLAAHFPRVHETMPPELVGSDSLLFTWSGMDPSLRPLLLLAHLDVVPVDPATREQWTHAPFGGVLTGGFAWGRGALDDKARAVATLEAMEHLLGQGFVPRRTVMVALGHDEEVGGHRGAQQVAALLEARGVRTFMTLDEGLVITRGIVPGVSAPVAVVGIAEKGYVTLELIAEAAGGHSSMPPPRTAVGRLGAALHLLEERPMPAMLDGPLRETLEAVTPEMPLGRRMVFANLWLFRSMVTRRLVARPTTNASVRTTFAPTMLSGSLQENVLAGRASALVNVRIHPRDSVDRVLDHARRVTAETGVRIRALKEGMSEPVPSSSTAGAPYRTLARTIRQVFPDALVAPGLMVGLTDSRHYRALSGEIFRFAPLRISESDRARFHGVDERIGIRNYREMITFFAQLIRNVGES